MLPQEFLERMENMLGEEYPAFLKSYDIARYQALRLNPQKGDDVSFLNRGVFSLERVPWEEHGYYYTAQDTPGKHPYHEAGVYYIQEPSAMAPAAYLTRQMAGGAGERILDLCAAPGGKSTQIAAAMAGRGILISNEIHPARAKILSENIERMGIANAVVTNETPQRLAEHFSEYFTRIMVDAPCSGEGMFRKNEEACEQWSTQNVELCAHRQDEILDCAASMLAGGGRLVYSTCTFAPAEDEGSIGRFLKRHPEFYVEEVPLAEGMSHGLGELSATIRLWPHKLRGEGHYVAVLRKEGTLADSGSGLLKNGYENGITAGDSKSAAAGIPEYLAFAGITATQINRFRLDRKFCGRCGHPTVPSTTERACICPECGQIEYPKISPAVIIAIVDTERDKILLTRYAGGSYRHWALVAGFVEVGETFKGAARREIMEEVGLKVSDLVYYKSQPWSFSDSAMIGFFAKLDGDPTITLQESELGEAKWFSREDVPDLPSTISVGQEMITLFKNGEDPLSQ